VVSYLADVDPRDIMVNIGCVIIVILAAVIILYLQSRRR